MWWPTLHQVCLAAAACLLLIRTTGADELDDLIDSVEDVVNRVAEEATREFAGRFPLVQACQCSRHACASTFDASDTCHEELGDAEMCEGCTGQKVGTQSVVDLSAPTQNFGCDKTPVSGMPFS